MIGALVILQAFLVAAQTAVVIWAPSPITIAGLVFTSLMFVLTFAMARDMR